MTKHDRELEKRAMKFGKENAGNAPEEKAWAAHIEDLIEAWSVELDRQGQPRLNGMAPGFRRGFDAAISLVARPLKAELEEEKRLHKVYEDTAEKLAEKSISLEARVKELESYVFGYQDQFYRSQSELSAAEKRERKLREALQFYAKPENWKEGISNNQFGYADQLVPQDSRPDNFGLKNSTDYRAGRRAAEALGMEGEE